MENQKPNFMFDNFIPKNRAVYEIMCKKNMVQPDRPQMAIWRLRIECCITKATDNR